MNQMSKAPARLAKGALRITVTYQGEERQKVFYKPSIVIGRAHGTTNPDFDLSPDPNVSRTHARISLENGSFWLEDLGSKFGTKVSGEDIRGKGRVAIAAGAPIRMGDSALKVDKPAESASGFVELAPQPAAVSTIEIRNTISAGASLPLTSAAGDLQQQALLLEILIQISLPAPLEQLLQTIIGRVVELISDANRGALLLRDCTTDRLFLAAFVSPGEPSVSDTLARRALKDRQAFVWRNSFGIDPAASIQRHRIESGMYAPLIYDGRPLGVLCVDNTSSYAAFSDNDLQLLVTVTDQAALAVSHHQLQEELREKTRLLEKYTAAGAVALPVAA